VIRPDLRPLVHDVVFPATDAGVVGQGSARIAVHPSAHAIGGGLGEAAVTCQAVLHMDRQFRISVAHRADRNVLTHTSPQVCGEFTVDERVDMAAIAEMIEVHHAGGNPTSLRMLPAE